MYFPKNIKEIYSLTARESIVKYNIIPTQLKAETHRNSMIQHNENNDYTNVSNTTNKVKSKKRKFIKSSPLGYNKTFLKFNTLSQFRNNDIKKTSNILSSSSKNKKIKPNIIKKESYKRTKIIDNKKQFFHTRNISNLYSNKIFNGIKKLFNDNNELIYNTINYEVNDVNKKKRK